MREHSGRWEKVDSDQLRATITADPLTATWKVARELNVDHSVVIRHLKQVGKVKKFDKWVPHELTANQKKCCFEASSSLILCNKDKPFLNWIVTCNAKWTLLLGFPSGSDSKESTCNARDLGLIPMSGRSPGQVNGYPLQHSCLDNPMDRGAWQATFYRVTKSWIWLSN